MQMVAPPRCSSRSRFHDSLAIGGIQVPGGLVGQQDGRIAAERARHRHALLLTARKLRRIVLDAVRHSDALQCVVHPLLAFGRGHPAIGQRQLHVFVDGEIANQIERLENESDLPVADTRALATA